MRAALFLFAILWSASAYAGEWSLCSKENEWCKFSGQRVVRYGANNKFTFKLLTDGVDCNNKTFGDPIVGTAKECYLQDPAALRFELCSKENEWCKFSGLRLIRYGATGGFTYKLGRGKLKCDNKAFGDPYVGVTKACYTASLTEGATAASPWSSCAKENEWCKFSGVKLIRYGADARFAFYVAKDGVSCDNKTFGDPYVGVAKRCESKDFTPEWSYCADENGWCKFSGNKIVRYGANGTFAFQVAKNGIDCNNKAFGDPVVGTAKQCEFANF